jgi:chaperonin GroEL
MTALDDLSHRTGAKAFVKAAGESLESVKPCDFGGVRRFWADDKIFGIVGGGGNPAVLRQHLRSLRSLYHSATETDVRKKTLERIGELMGSSVTLWVGGFTEPEINARKSLAQRAALTMRAAVQEGVVPGGGVALLNCRAALKRARGAVWDDDETAAYRILIEALSAPAHAIYRNAGYDPGEVMGKLMHENVDMGFDVVSGQVVNCCEAGILDSVLVLKTSVRNAIQTAGLALTIDSLVHLAEPEMVGKLE